MYIQFSQHVLLGKNKTKQKNQLSFLQCASKLSSFARNLGLPRSSEFYSIGLHLFWCQYHGGLVAVTLKHWHLKGRITEIWKEIFHALVPSLNDLNSQDWAGPKPDILQGLGHGWQELKNLSHLLLPSQVHQQRLGSGKILILRRC